jgi:hypothetical protein
MRFPALVLVWLAVWTGASEAGALIGVGDRWRYFPASQEASFPMEAWREPAFDDSKWPEGISGFSSGGEGTYLPGFGSVFQSVYFRKKFVLADPASVRWLVLRADFDDGFVAYLNGREVLRRNMPGAPGDPVPFSSAALQSHSPGQIEELDLSEFRSLLVPGTNTFALQLHGTGPGDYDVYLVPELLANFTRGPFIQNSSSNQVQVIWKTPLPADARVDYGLTARAEFSVRVPGVTNTLAPMLTNLVPDTLYYYRVSSGSGANEAASDWETFRTLKTQGPVSFVVFGDSGTGSREQMAVARVIREARPEIVLHVGDVIYPFFAEPWADTRCLSVYRSHMKNVPYYFAFGNHDLLAGDRPYLDALYLPTNSLSGTEHFYSFDHGDAHFTVLFQPFASQYLLTPGDQQHRWLANDLAATRKPWKFIFLHVPIATSGAHRFDDYANYGTPDRIDINNALMPLVREHGVQMVFAGHDHNYERFNPTNGTYRIVTGGGGVGLYGLAALDEESSQFWLKHHCVKVNVSLDALELEALDQNGQVFDAMWLQRTPPEVKIHEPIWHTPNVESRPPDDADGNLLGQEFDFEGQPIATMPGSVSSLGRFQVNQDAKYLYLGFAGAMLPASAVVLLFVESPYLPGITSLKSAPVESGLAGFPDIRFANFSPSMIGILGDEWADGQARSFRRVAMPAARGQGVFRLGRAFPEVDGVRLQQFNRSPQTLSVPGEQNADFIELAIPLDQLGPMRPENVVRIGAVIAVADAAGSIRWDGGYLGESFRIEAGQTAVLEAVEVKLIGNPFDPDGDGLLAGDEAAAGTDPLRRDSDGDGLPDGWEMAHRLDPLSDAGPHGATGDPDGDGHANLEEYLAGTKPRDAESVLRLRPLPMRADAFRFSWPAVVGRRYAVEISSAPPLRSGPLVLERPMTATSFEESFEDARAGDGEARFYRVRLLD